MCGTALYVLRSDRLLMFCLLFFYQQDVNHSMQVRKEAYENIHITKLQLFNCNENIYFNKSCLQHNVIPKYVYINIKTSNTSKATKHGNTARRLRIKIRLKIYT
jgi:hypothetical protein